ncbi:MAG: hypothetical protein Q8L81_05780 [Bacteroidota bacterium]|nr:hypothetical protein [Bacteroidota bacterium]
MKTIEFYKNLSVTERQKMLKIASGKKLDEDWLPLCLNCTHNVRMEIEDFGFICPHCKNLIGWDLLRIKESPLNKNQHPTAINISGILSEYLVRKKLRLGF